jgi:hypothetical protein
MCLVLLAFSRHFATVASASYYLSSILVHFQTNFIESFKRGNVSLQSEPHYLKAGVVRCAPEEGDSDLQEDSDISKELFRSQYGDMLHDTERE